MNVFDEYTKAVLKALNTSKVEYLVVGGYAVNFHGYERTTGDIDLWIKPDNNNRAKIIKAFTQLGISRTILKELELFDFTQPVVFTDGKKPFLIDFMTHVSGVKFEQAWEKKIKTSIESIHISFIHLNDLILTKIATGRPKDVADIDYLQKIQALKKKK